jgi:hypothetical protein
MGLKSQISGTVSAIPALGFQVAQQRIVENVCQNVEVGGKLK